LETTQIVLKPSPSSLRWPVGFIVLASVGTFFVICSVFLVLFLRRRRLARLASRGVIIQHAEDPKGITPKRLSRKSSVRPTPSLDRSPSKFSQFEGARNNPLFSASPYASPDGAGTPLTSPGMDDAFGEAPMILSKTVVTFEIGDFQDEIDDATQEVDGLASRNAWDEHDELVV
jgi:hypothetical protein